MEQPKENKMGTMPVNKLLVTMSLPMVISMIVQALYNIVDSIFVSRLSEDALTAVSMAFPMQNLMISVAVGTGVGINAMLSRALGKQDRRKRYIYRSSRICFIFTYRNFRNKAVFPCTSGCRRHCKYGYCIHKNLSAYVIRYIYADWF